MGSDNFNDTELPEWYRFWCYLRWRIRFPEYLRDAWDSESELLRFAQERGFNLTEDDLRQPWPMCPSRFYYILTLLAVNGGRKVKR